MKGGFNLDNKKPLVSIIIPVYNVQNYLKECLNSVLQQTYKSIEVITVDDGSTDDSPIILKEYDKLYENIQVYLENENRGQATARNIGLKAAKGEYILFVDSDDYINFDTVERLIKTIEKYNVDFVRFNAQSFSVEEEKIRQKEYNFNLFLKENFVYKKNNFKNVYLSFSPSPVLYLFKREMLYENNIKFMENIIHEDELFSSDIFTYANSCVYIDQPFYNRRYRKGSTMTEKSEYQKKYSFDSYIEIINRYNEMLESNQFDKETEKFLEYRINSLYVPLLNYDLEEHYKDKELDKVQKNRIYYSRLYKNYIRLLKAVTILKKKISK